MIRIFLIWDSDKPQHCQFHGLVACTWRNRMSSSQLDTPSSSLKRGSLKMLLLCFVSINNTHTLNNAFLDWRMGPNAGNIMYISHLRWFKSGSTDGRWGRCVSSGINCSGRVPRLFQHPLTAVAKTNVVALIHWIAQHLNPPEANSRNI